MALGIACLVCLPVCPTSAAAAAAAAQAGPGPRQVAQASLTAQQVLQMAQAGNVSISNTVVSGDLLLPKGGTFPGLISCQNCTFLGAFEAPAAVFDRVVDLTGSTFTGGVDVTGAAFKDRVFLDRTTFQVTATMQAARFYDDFSATKATLLAGLVAPRTLFGGKADFSLAHFASANFQGATFSSAFSFLSTEFRGPVTFESADARGEGNFISARFLSPSPALSVAFDSVTAEAPLHFEGDLFSGASGFDSLTSSSALTFKRNRFQHAGALYMESMAVHDLRMPVTEVGSVHGRPAQEAVLQLLEASAQGRGDLGTANDARFQYLSLRNNDDTGLHRLLDSLVYRDLGGYLVRPAKPIVALVILVLVCGAIRSLPGQWAVLQSWRRRPDAAGGPGKVRTVPHRVVLGIHKIVTEVLRGGANALRAAFTPKAEIEIKDTEHVRSYLWATARWSEYLTFKILLAVVVLSLGNSNATIRQILDSIRH